MTTTTTVQISEGIELKIYQDVTQEWYKDGKLHRDNDQPAIIYADGTKFWYKEGKYHREDDQPAIICARWNKSVV